MDPVQKEYIEPVSPAQLAQTVSQCKEERESCKRDAGSEALFSAEQQYIQQWRKKRGDNEEESTRKDNQIGLALSGGGIRSATFSLGIMQALVKRDLLKKVDYLSTVSGGGYIGSSVTWLTSKLAQQSGDHRKPDTFSIGKGAFPYGSDDPRPGNEQHDSSKQDDMLKYLREHGYYLTPGAGINVFSLLAAILRGTILNLLVWIPTFVLVFMLMQWLPGFAGFDGKSVSTPVYAHLLETLSPDISVPALTEQETQNAIKWTEQKGNWKLLPPEVATVQDQLPARAPFEDALAEDNRPRLILFEVILWLGFTLLAALITSAVVYSVATWFSRGNKNATRNNWYALRSRAERAAGFVFPLIIACVVIGFLPLIDVFLTSWLAGVGPAAALLGAILAIRDFLASGESKQSTAPGPAMKIGAAIFIYGIVLTSYMLGLELLDLFQSYTPVWVLAAVVLILGWFVNLNYISIHRFYRDRLMETFMPDIEDALDQRTGRAQGANTARLHDISSETEPHGPYHIVNTNVVLVSSKDPVYKTRGGDNFILSPLYCGSNATGWRKTEAFMHGKMTLATAVAISGAAANPNTGVGGVGLTRDLFVSLVMSLLNLRLGYWADNPNPTYRFGHPPNHFRPGAYALGNVMGLDGGGYQEHRDFVQLSDGGHFENMGLYELIRRRVKLAIVCDGGADEDFSFSDMQTTVRRIEDDFGARLKILDSDSPDLVVPDAPQPSRYPLGAGYAKQGHMIASITYADGSKGWLIFMKTTLTGDVSFKVKGYKAQNPKFPDESTADQFFDEVQFEAYRELGYAVADRMLDSRVATDKGDVGLEELFSNSGKFCPS